MYSQLDACKYLHRYVNDCILQMKHNTMAVANKDFVDLANKIKKQTRTADLFAEVKTIRGNE